MSTVFVEAGPAEILRSVQKDTLLIELIEKQLSDLLIKTKGTAIWLQYRQLLQVCSRLLYYAFTTLSGYQTLGEEYTNIVEVDVTLRYIPSFNQRLLMTVTDAASVILIEYTLNKVQRKIHQNKALETDTKNRILRAVTVLRALFPFLIHFHHAVFYWNGAYYDIIKRLIGIRYLRTKPWVSKHQKFYGFKILAAITMLHLTVSGIRSLYKWHSTSIVQESSKQQIGNTSDSKCPLCLEVRSYTSATTCGHLFCWDCILNWLQTNAQCPICREVIEQSRVVPLYNYY